MSEYKNAEAGDFTFDQHHFKFINTTYLNEVQQKLLPKPVEIIYRKREEEIDVPDFLVTKAEKEIKEIYFRVHELVNLYQESYFLYDRSNLVKQSFVNEINEFLPIYCSASFFQGKNRRQDCVAIWYKKQKLFCGQKRKKGRTKLANSKN